MRGLIGCGCPELPGVGGEGRGLRGEGGKVVLIVYASTKVGEKMALLSKILSTPFRDCQWILRGDWNMDEKCADKSSSCGKIMTKVNRRLIGELTTALHIAKTFWIITQLNFLEITRKGTECGS